ncbi:alpha/beta hydrolase [Alteraurantiacibacter aquimixticola]|uniref:Alpha/beta hydrolase n=1 Tax=Alteraurantiacibacter aquimixticola TaxID=2489173 RepID=A0A4T3F2T9_9SPHN|nr:alpha/beta hydrolase [Alteraurantiacibacter aquimixticola]TIX51031.1 alpha/beta hydrolase [Alteraurantiacibacter aquimixticola]
MRIAAILTAVLAAGLAAPAAAETYVYEEVVVEWVETSASRFVSPQMAEAEQQAIAAYGPFRVMDATRAALVGITTSYTPAEFDLMLADYPAIATIAFIECPGTHDDRANLRLGRMIRERGLATVVPEGGSVRSGAVELFLAGETRRIDDGAEFAVHAWLDERGMGAWDYAASSPEHRKYLDYYREMGMSAEDAARFYAMTNSVPFESALWLTGAEMRGWIDTPAEKGANTDGGGDKPRLAYLDFVETLN